MVDEVKLDINISEFLVIYKKLLKNGLRMEMM